MDDLKWFSGILVLFIMRIIKSLAYFRNNKNCPVDRQALFQCRQYFCQVLAIDIFHGNEIHVFNISVIKDLDNVRMLQKRSQTGFAGEHFDKILISGEMRQNAFDRHLSAETVFTHIIG